MWSRNKLLLSLAISAILPLKAGAQIVKQSCLRQIIM